MPGSSVRALRVAQAANLELLSLVRPSMPASLSQSGITRGNGPQVRTGKEYGFEGGIRKPPGPLYEQPSFESCREAHQLVHPSHQRSRVRKTRHQGGKQKIQDLG